MADDIICSKCSAPNPPDTVFCGKCGSQFTGDNLGEQGKDPLIGSFVGDRFLVHEKLGEGGMGIVYRAEQTSMGRTVALKVLHSQLTRDESLYARFQNEAAASSRLTHPNTVTIYDFGKTDTGSLYIAMEFIEGKSLDDEIHEGGVMNWQRACRIAAQICGSLKDAHDNNIVHRDLKPENVMLCKRGDEVDVAKVLDFGIAKILEDDGTDQRQALTKTGMVFGTPQYMSPEQIRGEKVDHRTDIYSLGVILYQMLAGTLPFSAEVPMGVLTKHLMDEPPPFKATSPNAAVPETLESVVMSTLEKDADKRPQTMKELAQLLTGAADSTASGHLAATVPVTITGKETKEKASTSPSTRMQSGGAANVVAAQKKPGAGLKIGIAVIVLLILGGAGGGLYFLVGSGAQKKPPVRKRPAAAVVAPIQPQAGLQGSTGQPQIPPTNIPVSNVVDQAGTQDTAGKDKTAALPSLPYNPGTSGLQDKKSANKKNVNKKDYEKKATELANLAKELEKDPNKKDEVIKEVTKKIDSSKTIGTDSKTDPKPKAAACVYSSSSDPVAEAILARLKSREAGIKKCVKDNDSASTSFKYGVPKGKSRPFIKNIVTSSHMDACLRNIFISGDFGKKEKAPRVGKASFSLAKEQGVVTSCRVNVNAKKVRVLLPIFKKERPDKNKSDDKKKTDDKKANKKKSPDGIKVTHE
ncbi:MAG: protein kinase [Proteobacteria bacterium]|nr:protein kinase [Pseudomonadota bacterium]